MDCRFERDMRRVSARILLLGESLTFLTAAFSGSGGFSLAGGVFASGGEELCLQEDNSCW